MFTSFTDLRTANLGAPAALVAGAVLVTLSETRETMQPKRSDKTWVRLAKQWFRFLIVSFGLVSLADLGYLDVGVRCISLADLGHLDVGVRCTCKCDFVMNTLRRDILTWRYYADQYHGTLL